MTTDLFLTDAELVKLTGRRLKSLQIAWLKDAGVAFRVNATGHPVVTRAAVEGRSSPPAPAPAPAAQGWTPRVIAGGT